MTHPSTAANLPHRRARSGNSAAPPQPPRAKAGRPRQQTSPLLIPILALLFALTLGLSACASPYPGSPNGGPTGSLNGSPTSTGEPFVNGDEDGRPLLVSASYPLPSDYQAPELVAVTESNTLVAAHIEQPLLDMLAAARAEGIGEIYLSSGYRTREEQAQLYDEAADKSFVQPPGASEHETGLAVDFWLLDESQLWLANNAWRFGFILRYPAGKEAITGISNEPWHFRYVGLEVARTCYEQGICLEEYLGLASEPIYGSQAGG
ncbi:MAG: M15 family metallopeptidase [Coriobacteriales bacterium]|nr:M15 family metallopeptidase [Coriobacteriales bacterium]